MSPRDDDRIDFSHRGPQAEEPSSRREERQEPTSFDRSSDTQNRSGGEGDRPPAPSLDALLAPLRTYLAAPQNRRRVIPMGLALLVVVGFLSGREEEGAGYASSGTASGSDLEAHGEPPPLVPRLAEVSAPPPGMGDPSLAIDAKEISLDDSQYTTKDEWVLAARSHPVPDRGIEAAQRALPSRAVPPEPVTPSRPARRDGTTASIVDIASAFQAGREDEACSMTEELVRQTLSQPSRASYCVTLHELTQRFLREGLGRASMDPSADRFQACAWAADGHMIPSYAHDTGSLSSFADCRKVCFALARDGTARGSWPVPISCAVKKATARRLEDELLQSSRQAAFGASAASVSSPREDISLCIARVTERGLDEEPCP